MFSSSKKLPDLFPQLLYQFIFPSTTYENPGYSTDYSPAFGIVSLFISAVWVAVYLFVVLICKFLSFVYVFSSKFPFD